VFGRKDWISAADFERLDIARGWIGTTDGTRFAAFGVACSIDRIRDSYGDLVVLTFCMSLINVGVVYDAVAPSHR